MEDSLALGRAQKGDSQKGAPTISVQKVAKWNASGLLAEGDAWVKAVQLAYSNYWASPQGQAQKAPGIHSQSDQSHAGSHKRTNFDAGLMNSVRARDEAWINAQEALGHSHAIFNPPQGKGKGRAATHTVTAAHAPIKPMIRLEKALSLTTWRREESLTDMHRLTDEERNTVLAALRTLIASIQAWNQHKNRFK